jgi:hypothetical protein
VFHVTTKGLAFYKKEKLLHSAARCHCFSTNLMLLIVKKTSDTWRPSAAIWTSHETKNCHRCSSLGHSSLSTGPYVLSNVESARSIPYGGITLHTFIG